MWPMIWLTLCWKRKNYPFNSDEVRVFTRTFFVRIMKGMSDILDIIVLSTFFTEIMKKNSWKALSKMLYWRKCVEKEQCLKLFLVILMGHSSMTL